MLLMPVSRRCGTTATNHVAFQADPERREVSGGLETFLIRLRRIPPQRSSFANSVAREIADPVAEAVDGSFCGSPEQRL